MCISNLTFKVQPRGNGPMHSSLDMYSALPRSKGTSVCQLLEIHLTFLAFLVYLVNIQKGTWWYLQITILQIIPTVILHILQKIANSCLAIGPIIITTPYDCAGLISPLCGYFHRVCFIRWLLFFFKLLAPAGLFFFLFCKHLSKSIFFFMPQPQEVWAGLFKPLALVDLVCKVSALASFFIERENPLQVLYFKILVDGRDILHSFLECPDCLNFSGNWESSILTQELRYWLIQSLIYFKPIQFRHIQSILDPRNCNQIHASESSWQDKADFKGNQKILSWIEHCDSCNKCARLISWGGYQFLNSATFSWGHTNVDEVGYKQYRHVIGYSNGDMYDLSSARVQEFATYYSRILTGSAVIQVI